DRDGPYHAAVPGPAALQLDEGDRPRLPEGGGRNGGEAGKDLLDGVLPAFDARSVRWLADRLRALPRLLRHPGGAGRRSGNSDLDEDGVEHRAVRQLGGRE